jgi:plastocyanin
MSHATPFQTVRYRSRNFVKLARLCLGIVVTLLGLAAMPARAATIVVHVFAFDFSTNPPGQPIVDPTIHLGDTIEWVWDADFHSTTSDPGQAESWDSDILDSGSVFDHTFTHLGTFTYYCIPHSEFMTGTITVVPVTSIPDSGTSGLLFGVGIVALAGLRRCRFANAAQ